MFLRSFLRSPAALRGAIAASRSTVQNPIIHSTKALRPAQQTTVAGRRLFQTSRPFQYSRRPVHTRWDPDQIRYAKPLVNHERLFRAVRHPRTGQLLLVAAAGGGVFYYTHLEEVPISGRTRFICFSEETVEEQGGLMYKQIMSDAIQQGALLPAWDRRSKMVARVMQRLIRAGELEHVNWEVHVLDSPETNAFVIPGGKVFVYTGILNIATDDDMLAAILGHEISHNLARHAAEALSSNVLLEPLRWILITLDATGYTLGLGRVLGEFALGFGIRQPASRKQESEADYIGLLMMAKACYDPNAAVKVWERMAAAEKASGQSMPEWLSTHPSNANRIQKMLEWLPKAEEARSEGGCAETTAYRNAFSKSVGNLWI